MGSDGVGNPISTSIVCPPGSKQLVVDLLESDRDPLLLNITTSLAGITELPFDLVDPDSAAP